MRPNALKALKLLFGLVFLAGSIALVRDTFYQGQDFVVFYRAAQEVWAGSNPYVAGRESGMVYKYPPWTLAVFMPVALLPLAWAKWLWGGFQVASLAACAVWLVNRAGARPWTVAWSLVWFWGIWAVHALDGQISLLLVAACLWSWELRHPLARAVTLGSLSFKVFPLIAAVGEGRRYWKENSLRQVLAFGLGVLVLLHLPLLLVDGLDGWIGWYREFFSAASSGGDSLAGEKVRGRDNQGFPAMLLRFFEIPSRQTGADLWAFAFFTVAMAGYWLWAQPRSASRAREAWVGWLGLTAAVHPLSWIHGFVFAFPLGAMALDAASFGRLRGARRVAACVGFVLLAAVSRNTLGSLGAWLELASARSWGILLCLYALSETQESKARAFSRA